MNELDKLFEAIKGLRKDKEALKTEKEQRYEKTFLVTGLGNPGREFQKTRHNIGFKLVEKIAESQEVTFSRTQSKALVTDCLFNGNRIFLVKPQTYMNNSGIAVQSLVKFYKVVLGNFLVIYDDVDLPFGAIRIRPSGGSAGHKGIQSIIDQLGTDDFPRMRLGVGRPPGSKQAANYVLKPFSRQESEFLTPFLDRAAEAALAFTSEGIDNAMTHYNRNDWL